MIILFEEALMFVILLLLGITDGLTDLFGVLAGAGDFLIGAVSTDFLTFVTGLPGINRFFVLLFLTGAAAGGLIGIFQIIKNMATGEGRISVIIGRALFGCIISLILIALILIGLNAFSVLLKALSNALSFSTLKISNLVFSSCADFINGYSAANLNLNFIGGTTAEEVLGTSELLPLVFFPIGWMYNGMINPDTFSYGFALLSSALIAISMIKLSVTLAQRVFELTALILLTPLAAATVTDGGERLKKWLSLILGKTMIAFGAVLSVSVYEYLLSGFVRITLPDQTLGNILVLFLITGGAVALPILTNAIASLFGEAGQEHTPGIVYGTFRALTETVRIAGYNMRADQRGSAERINPEDYISNPNGMTERAKELIKEENDRINELKEDNNESVSKKN